MNTQPMPREKLEPLIEKHFQNSLDKTFFDLSMGTSSLGATAHKSVCTMIARCMVETLYYSVELLPPIIKVMEKINDTLDKMRECNQETHPTYGAMLMQVTPIRIAVECLAKIIKENHL